MPHALHVETIEMATLCSNSTASGTRKEPSHLSGIVARNHDRSAEVPLEIEAARNQIEASTAALGRGGRHHPVLTISLQRRQMIGLDDCSGVEIHLRSGQLWITQADDYRDIIVQPGELFRLDRSGLALVTATQPSVLSIGPIDARIRSRLRLE